LLVVHQDPLGPIVEPAGERRVHVAQAFRKILVPPERDVLVGETRLLVCVQVVGRIEQRQHVGEPVPGEPEQLLLAAHLAVVAREPTGALRDCEPPGDDPREVARLEPLRPASPHAAPSLTARITSRSRMACAAGLTSWTRTIEAPCSTAQ